MSPMCGRPLRPISPDGGSILMTSAPRSRSILVQWGPARTRVKSTTRRPWRGADISISLVDGRTRPGLQECLDPASPVLGRPDHLVDLNLPLVGGADACARRFVGQHLDAAEDPRRARRELSGPGQRDGAKFLFGDDQVDDAPALEGLRRVAAAEHRNL